MHRHHSVFIEILNRDKAITFSFLLQVEIRHVIPEISKKSLRGMNMLLTFSTLNN